MLGRLAEKKQKLGFVVHTHPEIKEYPSDHESPEWAKAIPLEINVPDLGMHFHSWSA